MTKARDIATGGIDNSITASKLDVSGNGTAGQLLKSDGDGSFTWVDSPEPFQATTVSGTTHTLDLSSANYFNGGTTTGNTTLAFSNVPTAKTWSYDITIGGTSTANDILTTQADVKTVDLSTMSGGLTTEVGMSSDGTKMVTNNLSDNYLRRYTLSTAWDVSTATYASDAYYYGATGGLRGFSFDSVNGLNWYAIRLSTGSATIYHGTMSSAWDLSSSSISTSSPGLYGGSGGRRNSTFIKPDGTKLWVHERSVTGTSYSYIREYPLSTPFDLSSYGSPTNYDTTTFGATSPTINAGDVANYIGFNGDGSKFYIMVSSLLRVFSCSTAYDLSSSSISYDGNITLTTLDPSYTTIYGMFVGGTNQKEHIFLDYNELAIRYSSIGITAHTFTYPASVQNPTDIISTMEYQDKYKLEFITTDGGTNVWKTGHNKYQDN